MSASGETERRGLAGVMFLVERERREASELAAIGDSLLFPRRFAADPGWQSKSDRNSANNGS